MPRTALRVGPLTSRVASRWVGRGPDCRCVADASADCRHGAGVDTDTPVALATIQSVRVQPPAASAAQRGSVARSARDPGLEAAHQALLKNIRDVQDKWRKTWRSVELKRHDPIDLNEIRGWVVQRNGIIDGNVTQRDRDALNWTPDLRRYEAMLCCIGSPSDRAIEAVKAKATYEMGPPKTKAAIAAALSGEDSRPTNRRIANAQIGGGPSNQTFITTHVIRPAPDVRAVCPLWSPPDCSNPGKNHLTVSLW
jgi:hypothetical protein